MKVILFPQADTPEEAVERSIDIDLPHVAANLSAHHTCHQDGSHHDSADILIHRLTPSDFRAIHDAVGCPKSDAMRDALRAAKAYCEAAMGSDYVDIDALVALADKVAAALAAADEVAL